MKTLILILLFSTPSFVLAQGRVQMAKDDDVTHFDKALKNVAKIAEKERKKDDSKDLREEKDSDKKIDKEDRKEEKEIDKNERKDERKDDKKEDKENKKEDDSSHQRHDADN